MDPELRDLLAQRLQDTFQGELAAAVGGHSGYRHEPAHGGDGQQVSAAAPSHSGQCRLKGGHRPEYVDLELPPYLVQRSLLEGALQTVPGVGDDDIQRADVLLHLRDQTADGVAVGHVHDPAVRVSGCEIFEDSQVLRCAGGADDGVPGGQGGSGEGTSEARADPGDEPVPLLLHCLLLQ
ncbi:hypothetical protein AN220_07220 [Streptomyces nanshensis]|nr:hypothetical protein AN220_07220 [Streptomyces nanshensis]